MSSARRRDLAIAAPAVALLGLAVWYAVRPTSAPVAFAGPTVEDLDTLSRYLEPVPPAPEVEAYDMFVPALENVPVSRPSLPPIAEPPQPRRLSAILLVGDQPIAIIDDQQVRAGSVLPGGTQVVAIERTGVVLREPDGSRRTIRLSDPATDSNE